MYVLIEILNINMQVINKNEKKKKYKINKCHNIHGHYYCYHNII